ncbi:MAG: GatB/YqeY domain-containing protein [Candidatus Shapirobacteria bacterium]|nr:GatB/YqeY domain-containing protein [Candidatus Shapirobacteria bacterium]
MISKQEIEQQLKKAILNRDKIRVSVLRLLLSAIHNQEINQQKELTEEELASVVRKEAKNRRESIEIYRQAAREDLFKKEEAELVILSEFIPQELTENKIRRLIKEIISKNGFSGRGDFGATMGQVMIQVGNRADGSLVAKIVKEELN